MNPVSPRSRTMYTREAKTQRKFVTNSDFAMSADPSSDSITISSLSGTRSSSPQNDLRSSESDGESEWFGRASRLAKSTAATGSSKRRRYHDLSAADEQRVRALLLAHRDQERPLGYASVSRILKLPLPPVETFYRRNNIRYGTQRGEFYQRLEVVARQGSKRHQNALEKKETPGQAIPSSSNAAHTKSETAVSESGSPASDNDVIFLPPCPFTLERLKDLYGVLPGLMPLHLRR